ncbi:helix-turn-helix transcriptional regulator [Bacillus safensis]|uniref:helix-turn-helix domain-containing protein n=1 Tax=Bacillus safensis TaxID=561879 RepID=UPI00227F20E8|nr:helix-turn-helix transcriptional regulator [Bacillus safensis]MCY7542526.1 helix-turn-helix transcriptional regulator [Bacillus safensis]MCY7552401.1 helix-turn-helix transcriptional regulator [Bacillus safensis]MCY7644832.1 helix-turn-helix transcriptional regulator [Bacillus safensis]MCY7655853.1 helix-turn-helix transcriptional regulator [Bacillus safensis]MEC3710327.1 helix-turn-helix transcriptional regulator [Bacillus safensis]
MKISFKPMEITLIKRDKNREDLKRELGISGSTLAKMRRGEVVSLAVILKICDYLDCTIQEVVEFVREES